MASVESVSELREKYAMGYFCVCIIRRCRAKTELANSYIFQLIIGISGISGCYVGDINDDEESRLRLVWNSCSQPCQA